MKEKNFFLKIFKNLVRSKSNFVWTIKIIVYNVDDSAAKNFNILATSLNVLHNYFESLSKIICKSVSN